MIQISILADDNLLVFKINNRAFGLNIHEVDSILKINMDKIYQIPRSSEEVIGLYQYGTDVLPVIHLLELLKVHNIVQLEEKEDLRAKKIRPSIVTKIKGIPAILLLPEDPDILGVITSERSEMKDEIIKSNVPTIDTQEFVDELNLDYLFPNIDSSAPPTNVHRSEEGEDLDLSQYVLEDEE